MIRELIFHTGDEADQELFVEVADGGAVEFAICSDEEPETRVVRVDVERLEWLRNALSEFLAKKAPAGSVQAGETS